MRRYLRSFLTRETGGQFFRMGFIGALNTVTYFVLFNLFRFGIDWKTFWSVTVAFATATGVSYVLNRRWTFRIRSGWGSAGESGSFYVINAVAWGVTVLIVEGAERLIEGIGAFGLNVANVVATGVILLPKFAAYRDVVFRRSIDREARS